MTTVSALVRRPGPRLAEGLLTHRERSVVDVELAMRQWQSYVDALAGHGWRIIEVDPEPDCPDSVFVEDTAFVYDDLAVIARPGAVSRRREVAATERALQAEGYRTVAITAPATLEGGDVLKYGGTVWVGMGSRTNPAGAHQLAAHLAPFGVEVVAVPNRLALHLKSTVTMIPDGTVVGYPPIVDDPAVWPGFCPVDEESGAHVLILDERTVLMAASAVATRVRFEHLGLRVVAVDISEFEKLEGCITCLSIRLRR